MFRNKTILFALWHLFLVPAGSQQLNFIKYTVQDGLVANPVRCIYQDSKGFIWIGTFEGLSRYDGYKFINYTSTNGLSHNVINSITEVDQKLLVAENNGAIDVIRDNKFQKRLIAASAVNAIMPFRDRLLVTTDTAGFYEYKNDTITSPGQQRTNSSLGHILSINDSLLLTDGVEGHLMVFGADLSIYASLSTPGLAFYGLLRDSKERVWACTSGGLKLLEIVHGENPLIRFAPIPREFNFYPLTNAAVTSMFEDEKGSIWIGTSKGLIRIFAGGNFHIYNEEDGLPSAWVNTLYRDKEENLWIGTALGLAKWVSKNNVVFYNTEQKTFKNDVRAIFPWGNRKFILKTAHGLQQFNADTKEFKTLLRVDNYTGTFVAGGFPLRIYHQGKIEILDTVNNMTRPFEKLDSPVPEASFAIGHPDGTIFLGGIYGLYAVRKRSVHTILPYRITGLALDKDGNTWAATWVNGLFRIATKNVTNADFEVQDHTGLISEVQVRSLYVDRKKNIWVGTRYGGAFCLTPGSNGKFDVQHFNRQSGLMSDWVITFAETGSGELWIGTYLGLDKLVKEASGYRIFNFSKAVNFFAEIKNILPAGNNEWICFANSGIAIFKDENLHRSQPLQASILTASLGVLENKVSIILPREKVSLRPFQNAARFEFSSLGFINERQIMYSYRLKGSSDTSWSKPENIHEASYASLSPGNYTFEVKTIGWNGQDGTPAAFSFFIATPFWKQWWFIVLVAFAVASLFYALYRYRIQQLLRLQHVRTSIATDLHDDIGSSLTNISILSELSTKNLSQPEKAQPFLQRISEEVQASSQAMDDIIWSVNSRNDSLQETLARMRRYAAELFDNSETICHLQLDENSGSKKLSMEQRRDVYLIYKEALNNIHKHAQANNIWINVDQFQNHLMMRIKDDGKGFNADLVTHRNGLNNLKSRVEKWRGKIQVLSEKNKGTAIEIRIPLKD